MIDLFYYNWQVRDDWFQWCENISHEELTFMRNGGMGSFLKTLFHVIDCEQLWTHQMQGTSVLKKEFNSFSTLEEVSEFSQSTRMITKNFLMNWNKEQEDKLLYITRKDGSVLSFPYGKVIRHLISHEIHHIGQLSIWSRELGLKPVNSDLIIREYI
ncbi:damage-inducible protein DinB [Heyndrickxia oleronia]|uniref:DinB family protein n=1 Tax=Heyndrickxia oleronia TaxID=38875 RepID=UPI00333B6B3A